MGNVPTIRTELTTSAAVVAAESAGTPLADFYVDELAFLHTYYTVTAPDAAKELTIEGLMINKGYDIYWDGTP
jgi:hypothetical protein